LDDLAAQRLQVGRAAFGGWDDGDARLVRAAWCLTRHLRPERVLETGVARGLTSRAVLEAFRSNGHGHLWSVDLPPLLEHDLAQETGAAVREDLSDRWTLVHGSSRRVLPTLVADLGRIDLFVHDSMHTTRNLRFELERVWPSLAPGGAALIDDVEKNEATAQFLRKHPRTPSVISASDDGKVLICCLLKTEAEA
jgi:predicted O-methyltransferase YrrM